MSGAGIQYFSMMTQCMKRTEIRPCTQEEGDRLVHYSVYFKVKLELKLSNNNNNIPTDSREGFLLKILEKSEVWAAPIVFPDNRPTPHCFLEKAF